MGLVLVSGDPCWANTGLGSGVAGSAGLCGGLDNAVGMYPAQGHKAAAIRLQPAQLRWRGIADCDLAAEKVQ